MSQPLLVYVSGLRGPEPQKWHDGILTGSNTSKPRAHLSAQPISARETKLSLKQLEGKYPYREAGAE